MVSASESLAGDLSPEGYVFAGRRRKHDYARIVQRLGKEPDLRLAKEIGADVRSVRRLRLALRIDKHDRMAGYTHYLGRIPDRRLSKMTGICVATIAKRRKALGIPPCNLKRYNKQQQLRAYLGE